MLAALFFDCSSSSLIDFCFQVDTFHSDLKNFVNPSFLARLKSIAFVRKKYMRFWGKKFVGVCIGVAYLYAFLKMGFVEESKEIFAIYVRTVRKILLEYSAIFLLLSS